MSSNITSVQYLEKPVTTDEIKIASLLERTIKAIATKDLELLVSVYSDTASIEMEASRGMFSSKSEYRARMSKGIERIRNIYFRNTIIRVNVQEAIISCVTAVLLRGKAFPEKNQRYFKCVKEGEEWHIVEARYIA